MVFNIEEGNELLRVSLDRKRVLYKKVKSAFRHGQI